MRHWKQWMALLLTLSFIAYSTVLYYSNRRKPLTNVTVVLPDSTSGQKPPSIAHLPEVIKKVHGRKNTAIVNKTNVETYTFKDSTVTIKKKEIPYESRPIIYIKKTGSLKVLAPSFGLTFYPYFTVIVQQRTIGINIRFLYYKRFGSFVGATFNGYALIGIDYRVKFLNNRLLIGVSYGISTTGRKMIGLTIGF